MLIWALIIAHALDAVFGEPKALWSRLPHPAVVMGRGVSWLEGQMNSSVFRRAKGVLALAVLVIVAGSIGLVLMRVPGLWIEGAVAAIILAHRSLTQHVLAVAVGLETSIKAGREAVSRIVGRKTDRMDEGAVMRAAVESGAENLSDGVIAPAFWFLIGGLPGMLIYKVVNTADSVIGYKTEEHRDFGWAAARLDDVLNIVPARITGVLICLSAPFSRAFPIMVRDARKHRSPNAGWPEAAMAGALSIALSGPRQYAEGSSDDPYLNSGGRMVGRAKDIRDSVKILWRAWGLWMVLLVAIGMISLA